MTHLPYQPWCSACVEGGRHDPHRRRAHEDEDVLPVISFDDGFDQDDTGALRAMFDMDTCSGATCAAMMTRKAVCCQSLHSNEIDEKNGLPQVIVCISPQNRISRSGEPVSNESCLAAWLIRRILLLDQATAHVLNDSSCAVTGTSFCNLENRCKKPSRHWNEQTCQT